MPSAECRVPILLSVTLALAHPVLLPAQVVDSVLPPEVELARFRATMPGAAPLVLDGPTSRAELVRRFVKAVETNDSLVLNRLLISKAEFAYLYFPSSEYSRPPYRQKPGLVWFRMTETSQKGIGRVVARDGGKLLASTGHRCPSPPKAEAKNQIWRDCRLIVRRNNQTTERRLFGSILERNGHYKFLTYASDY